MPEYSFVLAGREGVGKSSLFAYIKNGMTPSEHSADIGSPSGRRNEDYGLENLTYETTVNDREASVMLWDTGGLERYDSMTANYYRNAHAVILVYDMTDEDSLIRLNEWVAEARRNSRWSERLVIALWGNKCDLKGTVRVKEETVAAFMDKHGIDKKLEAKVSSRKQGSIEKAMRVLTEQVDDRFLGNGHDSSNRDISLLTDDGKTQKACCGR